MRGRTGLVLCLSLALTLGPALEAAGARAATGSTSFAGTITLPVFPCPPELPGELPCQGNIEGSVAGSVGGLHQGSLWEVSFNTTLRAPFLYADLLEPGIPCSEGLASGSIELATSEPGGQAFGTYHVPILPRAVRNVVITSDFGWRRFGVVAVMDVSNIAIQIEVDQIGWITVIEEGEAAGVASFVLHVDPMDPPGCVPVDAHEIEGSAMGEIVGITAQLDQ